jgi:rod shape-determining protein MreD
MAGRDRCPGIRPSLTFGRRLDIAARHAFPTAVTLLLMLLADAPFGLAGQAILLPAMTLASVWFWSLHRPAAMPPAVVFVLGVLLDLLGFNPLGVGVLTLLATHGVAIRVQHLLAQQGFAIGWMAFVVVETAAASMGWALIALLTFRPIPFGPSMFQAVLTAALYPALAIPLGRAHRSIADPEQA